MNVRAVVIVGHTLVNGEKVVVGKAFLFGNVGDHVFPETVHTHIQPESQDLLNFLTDEGVVHIQIRLLYCKQMQVVFATYFIIGPCFSFKIGVPVVG